MMLVGAETHPNARIPQMTLGIIVINLLVFGAQLAIGEELDYGFSLVPQEITKGKDLVKPAKLKVKVAVPGDEATDGKPHAAWETVVEEREIKIPQHPGPVPIHLTLFTSMFMHTGVIHLLGNMWFLFLFGRNVEYSLGPPLYLAFYLVCGVFAGVAHVLSAPLSVVPCMGASGAISGVLGAYLFIYPLHKVRLWVGLKWIIEVPAFGALLVWALLQYVDGICSSMEGEPVGGTAYWAHLGGFGAGFLFILGMFVFLYVQKQSGEQAVVEQESEAATTEAEPPTATADAAPADDPFARALETSRFLQGTKQPAEKASPHDQVASV